MRQVVEVNSEELLQRLRHDCVTFFAFYLQDDLYMRVPEFHIDIWNELLEHLQKANMEGAQYQLRKLFAVPRGHAKSTIAKLATILFILYSPLYFVLYVSKSNILAKNAVRDIIEWLESPEHQQLHGPTIRKRSSESDSQWTLEVGIRVLGTGEFIRKVVIFRALGSEQQIRGMLIKNKRPQIIIIDDIEDYSNTHTPEARQKVASWFMGELLKAFDENRHFVMFIGNMICDTSLLARLSKLPEWNPTIYGSLVYDKNTDAVISLWEEKNPKAKLLKEYETYQGLGVRHIWEAEMMNLTHEAIMEQDFVALVQPPLPTKEELTEGFLCLDPAYGKKAYNDQSAITIHARIMGVKVPVIIDSACGHWNESELFDELLNISMLWGITVWCIEANAAQQLLIPLFKLMFLERGMNDNAITFIPISKGKQSKGSHINAFRAAVGAGSYGIVESQSELLQLLKEYIPEKTTKDDLLDSSAYGLLVWSLYSSVMKVNGIQSRIDFSVGNDATRPELIQGIMCEGL